MPVIDPSFPSTSSEKISDDNAMDVVTSVNDFSSPEKQEARAFLRERFLRVITGVVGKSADFQLYENTSVSGEFRGCDIDFINLYVRNLKTPLGAVPEAVLRTSDMMYIELKEV